jgi:type 1 glutamine amidotransferase
MRHDWDFSRENRSMFVNRRELLRTVGAGLFVPAAVGGALAQEKGRPKKVLFFTRSAGYEHSVIKRNGSEFSLAERILTELGKEHGFDVTATKDGRLFNPDQIGQWDAFAFETTGDLTAAGEHDQATPMTKDGEQAFYDAIRGGKGFIGMHCATDSFGHHRKRGADDPYIQMIGAEFAGHGNQQEATIDIADPGFPGVKAFGSGSFKITDEWYGLKNIASDLHVIFVQKTKGMEGRDYQRPSYPETWARMHGKGRVFYTSMGHREDVWENSKYQQLVLAALSWVTGRVDADVTPNITRVTPEYQKLPA